VYVVTVKGAMHNSFSDMPFIAPERYRNIKINAERALSITNAYLLAFFDRYLQGRQQTLLKASDPMFPEVTLNVYRHEKHNHNQVKFARVNSDVRRQDFRASAERTVWRGFDDRAASVGLLLWLL